MGVLGEQLIRCRDEIVQRWYEVWQKTSYAHEEIQEALIKNGLADQLRLVGEQLQNFDRAEAPDTLWKVPGRLDPEKRVFQGFAIEELVQEYRIAVQTVRDWIEERELEVPFAEYSYFYQALFELTAESVRRYSQFQREQVRKARADYLASLAHQMRGPLSVLAGQVDLLEDDIQALDASVLSRFRRNLNRMLLLVNGVMRLERFKIEEVPVRPEPVDAAVILRQLLSDHEFEAAEKGLRLEICAAESLPVVLDPNLFADIAGNLVQNALKYTGSGFVRVEAGEEGDSLVLRVIDSGSGISPAMQKELFKPISPMKGGGVGVGLTIVHRAVTAQGGDLGVESEPGKGSTFWVRLPRKVSPRHVQLPMEDSAPFSYRTTG